MDTMTTGAALQAAEALIFPEPPEGQVLVRQRFPGGTYISTGAFDAAAIGPGGKGRSAENLRRINTLFFDADVVALFKAKYLKAKPDPRWRAGQWKTAMFNYRAGLLDAAKDKHLRIVGAAIEDAMGPPTATVDSGWGWHWFYALADDASDPAYLPRLVELHNLVRAYVQPVVEEAWGCRFHDPVLDATQDAGTRIVRAWGSLNTKCAKRHRRCRPVSGSSRLVSRADIESLLTVLRSMAPVAQAAPPAPRQAAPATRPAIRVAQPAQDAGGVEAPPPGEPLDFSAYTHQGRTWHDLALELPVDGTIKVCCPFAGTSVGSGFISRKTKSKVLFRSNALSRTWWADGPISGTGAATLDSYSTKDGEQRVRQTIRNVYRLLREDEEIDLWTCTFRQLPMIGEDMVDPKVMQTRVRMVMEEKYDWFCKVSRADVETAILDVCAENERNSIADRLSALVWDGQTRLDGWLSRVLGVENIPLVQTYSRRWLIALVARIMEPGCKVDNMLLVMGRQGFGKSTLFKQIANFFGEDLHVDTAVDWRHKDSRDVLRGTLIYEDAELESFHRAGVDLMKNMLSAQTDTYRPSYGRTRERFPRTAVMVGTANPTDILKDPTGNRRFWLVNAYTSERRMYDRAWLGDNIEQLVAEAYACWTKHQSSPSERTQWWLTTAERGLQSVDNEQAMKEDLLQDAAERVFAECNGLLGSWFTAREFAEHYAYSMGIATPSARQLNILVQQASRALRTAGFDRQKVTNPVGGTRANWYIKHVENSDRADIHPVKGLRALLNTDDDNVVQMRSPQ